MSIQIKNDNVLISDINSLQQTIGGGSLATSAQTLIGAINEIHDGYLPLTGGTITGQLYLNYSQDVGLNSNGSLIIGDKNGLNIAIDNNEIMARNNGVAGTLYLNTEGGEVYYGISSFSGKGDIIVSDGKKIQTNGIIVGYAYNGISNNNAAYLLDKPGSYWTGIGANGTTDVIHFGPCNADGSWVEAATKTQKWDFQGSTTISGGITSKHGHDFVVAGNEVNFIPDGYNSTFWFNYETFNRANNGTISNYLMGNGKHGYASVTASAHNTSSSILIKENVVDMIEDEINVLKNIRPVKFDYIEAFGGAKDQYGFIAEEIEEYIPSIVFSPKEEENEIDENDPDKKEYKSIDYSKLTPFLVKGWQLHEEYIQQLEQRIAWLENNFN